MKQLKKWLKQLRAAIYDLLFKVNEALESCAGCAGGIIAAVIAVVVIVLFLVGLL
jgi:hypothetical protein